LRDIFTILRPEFCGIEQTSVEISDVLLVMCSWWI